MAESIRLWINNNDDLPDLCLGSGKIVVPG